MAKSRGSSVRARLRASRRAARKANAIRKRMARRAARRAALAASFRRTLVEIFGPKIIASSREVPMTMRVVPSKRPLVMHKLAAAGESTELEQYRATFAGDGRRREVEFDLDPDSDREIKAAARSAAEVAHGARTRGWHLIKVEPLNELAKEMLK